jgi:putative inorganic carbon (HCO3(-)) transporter
MGSLERLRHRFPAWLDAVYGSGAQVCYWLVACLFPLLFIHISPLATLGLATLGGLFLGRETARSFERNLARNRLPAPSLPRAALWHWLIVGAIALNYAWFVFTDRPFVPGLLFLITLIVLRCIRTRSLFPLTPLDLPIALLLLLTTLFSAVASVKSSLSYPKLYGVAFSIVLFYEMVYGLQQEDHLARWLVGLHLLGLAIASLGLVGTDWFLNKVVDLSEVYTLIPQRIVTVPRSLQGGFHPNGIAGTLIYLIPLYIVALRGRLFGSSRHRRLYTGLTALTLVSTTLTLLLTQSRGAVAGLAIACVALFFALKRRFRWSLLSIVCLLLLWVLLLASLPLLANMPDVVEHTAVRQLLRSYHFRQRAWRLGLTVLETFPIKSAGIGTFDHVARYLFPPLYFRDSHDLLRDRHTTITHAHNELLQVAIDLGIPGFVAYVALLAAFARTAHRVYTWATDERLRRLILGLGAGMLAHQIFGLTDAFLLGTKPGIVMWMIMGLTTGLYLTMAPDPPAP